MRKAAPAVILPRWLRARPEHAVDAGISVVQPLLLEKCVELLPEFARDPRICRTWTNARMISMFAFRPASC